MTGFSSAAVFFGRPLPRLGPSPLGLLACSTPARPTKFGGRPAPGSGAPTTASLFTTPPVDRHAVGIGEGDLIDALLTAAGIVRVVKLRAALGSPHPVEALSAVGGAAASAAASAAVAAAFAAAAAPPSSLVAVACGEVGEGVGTSALLPLPLVAGLVSGVVAAAAAATPSTAAASSWSLAFW